MRCGEGDKIMRESCGVGEDKKKDFVRNGWIGIYREDKMGKQTNSKSFNHSTMAQL